MSQGNLERTDYVSAVENQGGLAVGVAKGAARLVWSTRPQSAESVPLEEGWGEVEKDSHLASVQGRLRSQREPQGC